MTQNEIVAPVMTEHRQQDDILWPGAHLIELEFQRPVADDVLTRVLQAPLPTGLGFTSVVFDQSLKIESSKQENPEHLVDSRRRWSEWGSGLVEQPPLREDPIRYRFVGFLSQAIRTQDTSSVRWMYARPLSIQKTKPPSEWDEDLALEVRPFPLETGRTYDLLFLARMRAQPTRSSVCDGLAMMGFSPIKISALKRSMRMKGRPGAGMTLWVAVGRWEGPASYINDEDPFYFEDVTPSLI